MRLNRFHSLPPPKEVGMQIIIGFFVLVFLALGLISLFVFVAGLFEQTSDTEDPRGKR